ncbi:MAG: chemotaxis protein CheC [Solirubrobacteraceae bacterium]
MTLRYTEIQLDALRELANIASGTAATSLSQLLGHEVGLSVPNVVALDLADAVDAAGDPGETVTGVALGFQGDTTGVMLLLLRRDAAAMLCAMLDVEPGSEVGDSALGEVGNILGAGYLTAIGAMTGVGMEPSTPFVQTDLLGAIVASLLAQTAGSEESGLLINTRLDITDESCTITFLLLPEEGGVHDLLAPLGLAESVV